MKEEKGARSKLGYFVISLDFELQYGIEDKRYIKDYKHNILGGRNAIEKMLLLFKKYEIHATWAVVGMMFNESLTEWNLNRPKHIPKYRKPIQSIYDHMERMGEDEVSDPFHYGLSLISKIMRTPNQEIASHTYSHFYCNEYGARADEFLEDIKKAVEITEKKSGEKAKSIVFPRNQINKEFIELLKSQNIRIYRGCQKNILYNKSSDNIFIRGMRLIDAYTGISGYKSYPVEELYEEGMCNVKASAMFRPYNSKISFFERLKVNTIKRAMLHAAQNGEIYHLWWHPHNMGNNTDENMRQLQEILHYFNYLNKTYGMKSSTMREMGELR